MKSKIIALNDKKITETGRRKIKTQDEINQLAKQMKKDAKLTKALHSKKMWMFGIIGVLLASGFFGLFIPGAKPHLKDINIPVIRMQLDEVPGINYVLRDRPGSAEEQRIAQFFSNKTYMGETGDGFSYIRNTNPIQSNARLQEYQKNGYDVINSETLGYGLLQACSANDEGSFDDLVRTVTQLSRMNYNATRTIKLLPWAVIVKKDDGTGNAGKFEIPQDGDQSWANASAADADLDILTALIIGREKGWGGEELKFLIHTFASEIINQDVKKYDYIKAGKYENTSIFSTGGFIDNTEVDGNLMVKYYPAYPNIEFLSYIADYFKPTGISNFNGSTFLYSQFSKLRDDSQKLQEALRDKYKTPQAFPEYVYVGVDENGNYTYKDKINDWENPLQGAPEANKRLLWRSGEALKGFFAPIALTDEDSRKTDTYYQQLGVVTKLDSPAQLSPITFPFYFRDTSPRDKDIYRAIQVVNSHWGGYAPNLVKNDLYELPFEKAFQGDDSSVYPNQLESAYSEPITIMEVSALKNRVRFARAVFQSNAYAEQPQQAYRDTFVKLLMCDSVDNSILTLNVLPRVKWANETPSVEMVSDYFVSLRSMKGYTDKEVLREIDLLLSAIPADKRMNTNNAVLKSLYTEKMLLWENMTPQEQTVMKAVATKFNLTELTDYFSSRQQSSSLSENAFAGNNIDAATSRAIRDQLRASKVLDNEYKVNWEIDLNKPGVNLGLSAGYQKYTQDIIKVLKANQTYRNKYRYQPFDIALVNINGTNGVISTDNATVEQVRDMDISSSLKKKVIEQIVNRELQVRNNSYSETMEFMNSLPDVYRNNVVLSIIYNSNFKYEDRLQVVQSELGKLDVSTKDGITGYLSLLQAYQVMLFNEQGNIITQLNDKTNPPANPAELKASLNKVAQTFSMVSDLLEGREIGKASIQALEPLHEEDRTLIGKFADKFSSNAYNAMKAGSRESYARMIVQNIDLSFWFNQHLAKLYAKDPNELKAYPDFYGQYTNSIANLKKFYTENGLSWQKDNLFYIVNLRGEMEQFNMLSLKAKANMKEGKTLSSSEQAELERLLKIFANPETVLNELHAKQAESERYRRDDEVAALLGSELYILDIVKPDHVNVNGVKLSADERVQQIISNDVFKFRGRDGKLMYGYIIEDTLKTLKNK